MDLYALLAKKSVETTQTGAATSSRTKAAQGFADALSAARLRLASNDPTAALGNLFKASADTETATARTDDATTSDRRNARAEAAKESGTDGETRPRARRVEKTRDDESAAADTQRTEATADDQTADAVEEPEKTADASATPKKKKTDAKASETDPATTATKTEPQQAATTSDAAQQAAAALTPQVETPTAPMGASPTEGVKTAAPTTADANADADAAPQAQTAQPQLQAGTPTAAQPGAENAPTQDATQPAQGTKPQAQTAAAETQSQAETADDPLARAQAAGIAERLNEGDKVSVKVKVSNPATQQSAQPVQAPTRAADTAQPVETSSRPVAAAPLETQSAVSAVATSADAGGETANHAFTGGENPAQAVASGTQAAATPTPIAATPSLFQQTLAAQAASTQTQASATAAATTTATEATAAAPVDAATSTATDTAPQPQATAAALTASQDVDDTDATQTARAQLPKTPVPPKQIADQVKVSIAKGVDEGMDKINIRLRPGELGRIEVKLNVADDGTVQAMVTADRPETLDVLKRDSAGLEKALQDAGLKTNQDSLSFNLRDQGNQGAANNDNRNKTPYGRLSTATGDDLDTQNAAVAAYTGSGRADGIDIRV